MIDTISDIATYFATNIDTIADVATIITILALVFAWAQLRAQSRATATGIYHQYINLAVQYPRFAEPNYEEVAEHRETDYDKFKQYEWFVSSMLYACEAVLLVFSRREDWMHGITAQLDYHREYLNSDDFKNVQDHWHPDLVKLIDQVIAGKSPYLNQ